MLGSTSVACTLIGELNDSATYVARTPEKVFFEDPTWVRQYFRRVRATLTATFYLTYYIIGSDVGFN